MIVEFTIKNYRSIKDEQTFSFYAGDYKSIQVENKKYNELPDNVVYLPKEENGGLGLLKVAAIYGANASGKSNILQAFDTLQDIIKFSKDLKEGDGFKFYDPYKLCEETKKASSKFEIEFFCNICLDEKSEVKEAIRFIYQIEVDSSQILAESLDFFPKGRKATLFRKEENDTWETMYIGNYVRSKIRRMPLFSNQSYLSKQGESVTVSAILKDVYMFLVGDINYISVNQGVKLRGLSKRKNIIDKTAKALSLFDTGVIALKFDKTIAEDFFQSNNRLLKQFDNKLQDLPEQVRNGIIEDMFTTVSFMHQGQDSIEYFDENDISGGTQKLFDFLPVLFETFKAGGVLVIDELETKFHPHIADLIIKLFNDGRVNRKGAQLIFSTHSTELMDNNLLRRDQIWFTEKVKGETVLFSLRDFESNKVRSDSPYAKWYIEGRFGAIPRFNYLEIADLFADLVEGNEKED